MRHGESTQHTRQRLKPVVGVRLGTELVQQARTDAGQVGAAAAQHEVGGHGSAHVARALMGEAGRALRAPETGRRLTKTDRKKDWRLG